MKQHLSNSNENVARDRCIPLTHAQLIQQNPPAGFPQGLQRGPPSPLQDFSVFLFLTTHKSVQIIIYCWNKTFLDLCEFLLRGYGKFYRIGHKNICQLQLIFQLGLLYYFIQRKGYYFHFPIFSISNRNNKFNCI